MTSIGSCEIADAQVKTIDELNRFGLSVDISACEIAGAPVKAIDELNRFDLGADTQLCGILDAPILGAFKSFFHRYIVRTPSQLWRGSRMWWILQAAVNTVLTLAGGEAIDFDGSLADDAGGSTTIGPGTAPGTTNGGD